MPTLDARAGRLDVLFHPGNTADIVLTWPSALTGRTFSASAGMPNPNGTATVTPTVTIDDDTITVAFSEAQTTTLGEGKAAWWKLTETTVGTQDAIAGKLTPNAFGSGHLSTTGTVVVNNVSVTVEVVGSGGVGVGVTDGDKGDVEVTDDGETWTVSAAIARLASPAFTGTPTAPTAAPGTNTTQLANTAFVAAAVAALINSAPGVLDTLDELAAALGDDANFAATVTTALAGKQPLDADLTAIAALSTTAYGRAFLALADAAAARTALALGTAATSNTSAFDAAGSASTAQAFAIQRANHTGSQTISTVTNLQTTLDAKAPLVDLAAAVNLSTNPSITGDTFKVIDLNSAGTITVNVAVGKSAGFILRTSGSPVDPSWSGVDTWLTVTGLAPSGLEADSAYWGAVATAQDGETFLSISEPITPAAIGAATAAALADVVTDVTALGSDLTDEIARATAAEADIASDLADEATLARNASNLTSGTVAAARIDAAIARLASPTFTGTPAAPTATAGTSTTQIATTAFAAAVAADEVMDLPQLEDSTDGDITFNESVPGTMRPVLGDRIMRSFLTDPDGGLPTPSSYSTKTSLTGTKAPRWAFPANRLVEGAAIELEAYGTIDAGTANIHILTFDLGSTALLRFALDMPVSSSNTWHMRFHATIGEFSGMRFFGGGSLRVTAPPANEVQTISRTATGGTVTFTFDGQTTAATAVVAATTNAQIRTALESLSNIDSGDVTVSGAAGGPFVVTFATGGRYQYANVPAITVDASLATGGTVSIAQTTAGQSGSTIRFDLEQICDTASFDLGTALTFDISSHPLVSNANNKASIRSARLSWIDAA